MKNRKKIIHSFPTVFYKGLRKKELPACERRGFHIGLFLSAVLFGVVLTTGFVGTVLGKESEESGKVLAAETQKAFLEINADMTVNGKLSLKVPISVNGADLVIDQSLSQTSTPTFANLNLTAGKIVLEETTQTLKNKSLSGSSNTFTSIPNSALSNSKVTVSPGTNLTGGGDVSLGSSVTLTLKDSLSFSSATISGNLGVVGLATVSGMLSTGGNFVPLASGVQDIGTSSFLWGGFYATTATVSGTLGVGGEASLSGKLVLGSATPQINAVLNRNLQLGFQNTGRVELLATTNFLSSSALSLTTGSAYQINGTDVLSATTLGSGVTASSLTSVGTIGTGVWQGTAVGAIYGGTGQTTVTTGDLLYGSASNTWSKLAGVATGNALISGGVSTAPSWGKVVLGTHTSGNYVSSAIGTANQVNVSGATGDVTFSLPQSIATSSTPTFGGLTISGNASVSGTLGAGGEASLSAKLTLDSLTPQINATNNRNLQLGFANTGRIEFLATTNYLSSSVLSLTTGSTYQINGADVLSATTLGSGVATSSLTTVGTIGTGVWQGTAVGPTYGGTGQTTVTTGDLLYGSATNVWSKLTGSAGFLKSTGTVAPAWTAIAQADVSGLTTASSPTFAGLTISGNATVSGTLGAGGEASLSAKLTLDSLTPQINATNNRNLQLGFQNTGRVELLATTNFLSSSALSLTTGSAYQINGTSVLSATTLGSGVTASSLTSLGTIATGAWNGTAIGTTYGGTGQNFGSTAQGNVLYFSGAGTMAALGPGTAGQFLKTGGAGANPSWDTAGGGSSNWRVSNGALSPLNDTEDVLIGNVATASAKFGFINVFSGTPTATIAGNITLDAAGVLQTTKMQTLTIGGASTGNISFSPQDGTGTTTFNGNVNFTGALKEDGNEILSGVISAFASACPTGWTEYTAARGRTVVGTPASGTNAGTVGTALTNLEDKTHTHSVDPASTATDSQGAHTHTGPSHTHSIPRDGWGDGGVAGSHGSLIVQSGHVMAAGNGTTGADGTGATSSNGAHTHSVDIAAFNSAATSATMPYIQLTYCQKSAGADLAEWVPASEDVASATIVSADPDNNQKLIASRKAYDQTVVGIIATKPGWLIGDEISGSVQMALAGRVPTRVTLKNGEINRGDAITTSEIAGVGMKATKAGSIIGKAMEPLNEQSSLTDCGGGDKCGVIAVFVNVSYFDPATSQDQYDTQVATSQFVDESIVVGDTAEVGDMVNLRYSYVGDTDQGTVLPTDKNDSELAPVGILGDGGDGQILQKIRLNGVLIGMKSLITSGVTEVNIASTSAEIHQGDLLGMSEVRGKAKKSTITEPVIGKALEDWDPDSGRTKIRVFVQPGTNLLPILSGVFDLQAKVSLDNVNIATVSAKLDQLANDVAGILSDLPQIKSDVELLKEEMASVSAKLTQLSVFGSQLSASGSSVLGSSESGKLITDNLDVATVSAEFVEVLDTMKVIGHTQLADTTVGGKLTVGLLTFDDLLASIKSLTGKVVIDSDLSVAGDATVSGRLESKIVQIDEIGLKDEVTGDYYCLKIKNGELDKTPGKCQ